MDRESTGETALSPILHKRHSVRVACGTFTKFETCYAVCKRDRDKDGGKH